MVDILSDSVVKIKPYPITTPQFPSPYLQIGESDPIVLALCSNANASKFVPIIHAMEHNWS